MANLIMDPYCIFVPLTLSWRITLVSQTPYHSIIYNNYREYITTMQVACLRFINTIYILGYFQGDISKVICLIKSSNKFVILWKHLSSRSVSNSTSNMGLPDLFTHFTSMCCSCASHFINEYSIDRKRNHSIHWDWQHDQQLPTHGNLCN